MLDRLPEAPRLSNEGAKSSFEDNVLKEHTKAKKAAKTFLNNAGIFVGVFIVFAVVVIVTTDIRLASFADISALCLDFFLLLFCSYSMHITCADSGMRAGLNSKSYSKAAVGYEEQKQLLIEKGLQGGLFAFCQNYIQEELKNARMNHLVTIGFTYSDYTSKWMGAGDEAVLASSELSSAQKKAIMKANKLKPIALSPESIVRRARSEWRRGPLGASPESKKRLHFGFKFVSSFLISAGIAVIALEVVKEPTWAIFASVMLKLLAVILNGFSGYKFGYENIVIDTVGYISDQTDLLKQAIAYIEKNEKISS